MNSLKITFTLLTLLTIVFLIFKFSFWTINLIIVSSTIFLLIDIFKSAISH